MELGTARRCAPGWSAAVGIVLAALWVTDSRAAELAEPPASAKVTRTATAPSAGERAPTRSLTERLRDEMFDDLMAWAVRLTGLPPAKDRPEVIPMSAAQLSATVCPDVPSSCRGLMAVYDTERTRVLIRDTLDLREMAAQSFIVHEFIHHLQHRAQGASLTSGCEQVIAAERQAYEAQNRFLQQHRQLLRVGEMLRSMRCDSAAASEPTVQPLGAAASLTASVPSAPPR